MEDPLDQSQYRGAGFNDFVRKIPFIGDLYGGLGVETAAEVNKKRAMDKVMRMLVQYRPEQLQTRQNSLDNAMKLFKPVNRALVNAYGSDAALPIEKASKSPFPDQVMADMKGAAGASQKRPYYSPAMEVFMEGAQTSAGKKY